MIATQSKLVIAEIGGTYFAFCGRACLKAYREGTPVEPVNDESPWGCWLCGRDLSEGTLWLT